jgi:hypothetical protein
MHVIALGSMLSARCSSMLILTHNFSKKVRCNNGVNGPGRPMGGDSEAFSVDEGSLPAMLGRINVWMRRLSLHIAQEAVSSGHHENCQIGDVYFNGCMHFAPWLRGFSAIPLVH